LYERILDTDGFAFYFNELTKLAMTVDEPKSPPTDIKKDFLNLFEEYKDDEEKTQ
jgi:hypothetical protein